MAQSQYQFPLTRYLKVYGVSYRTILRWAEKGYPLDDESATRLLVASQKNSSGASKSPVPSHSAPSMRSSGALGLAANIRRLQEAEAEAAALYQNEPDPAIAASHRKAWLAISEQLRKVEQSNPDVEQANKKTLRLEDLQTELSGLFSLLRQDLETLPGRIALELVSKDEIGIREILRREIGEIVFSLHSCKYLGGGSTDE